MTEPLARELDLARLPERDKFLDSIGFDSYADYLQSDLWHWIRGQLAAVDLNQMCCCCGSTFGLVWHHRTYAPSVLVGNFSRCTLESVMRHGILFPIVRMCNTCHSILHTCGPANWSWDDSLRSLIDRNEALVQLMVPNAVLDRFLTYRATLMTDTCTDDIPQPRF